MPGPTEWIARHSGGHSVKRSVQSRIASSVAPCARSRRVHPARVGVPEGQYTFDGLGDGTSEIAVVGMRSAEFRSPDGPAAFRSW